MIAKEMDGCDNLLTRGLSVGNTMGGHDKIAILHDT